MNRHTQTLADCAAAIRKDPKYALAYSVRARVFLAKGDTKTALSDCRRAIQYNDKLADPYYVRGLVHEKLKKKTEAIADYSNAISRSPKNGRYYNARAVAHLAVGRPKSSYNDVKQATLYSSSVPLYWSNRGRIAREAGDYNDSIAAYSKAFSLLPLPKYLNSRGVTYLKLKKNSTAAKDFSAAIVLHRVRYQKDNHRYYYNKGLVSRLDKDYKKALIEFTAAIRVNPKYAKAFYVRGLVLKQMGRADLAAKDFALAKKYDPKAYGKLKITKPRKGSTKSSKTTRTTR